MAYSPFYVSDEWREYGSIPWLVYGRYLRKGGTKLFGLFVLLSVVLHSTKVYLDYLLKDSVAENISYGSALRTLHVYALISFGVILVTLVYNIIGQWIGASARQQLHSDMLQNLFRCPVDLFEAYPIGRILNRLSCDMFVIDQKLPSCLQRLVLYWAIQNFYRCSSRELQRLESISCAPIFSHFSDTLTGLLTIRSFRVQPKFINQLCEKIDKHTAALLIHGSGTRWLGVTLDYVGSIIVFAAMIVSVSLSKGSLDPNTAASVGLSVSYILLVPIYLAWVCKFIADLENYMNAVERVLEYTNIESEEKFVETTEKFPNTKLDMGDIKFHDVCVGYGSVIVMAGLNLTIPRGQKIAICGRSGSGKSTLAMTLVGMASKIDGKIFIGDKEIHSISYKKLRENISMVQQESGLFSGSLRFNLDPTRTKEDRDIWEVVEKLRLAKFIRGLEYGLSTQINDSEKNYFSHEITQQIVIARSLLRGSSILILDEATSSMSHGLESDVHRLLTQDLPGVTVIVIAHRLANLKLYDRILVVGEGRILEDGSPIALLNKPMGFFTALWRKEMGRERTMPLQEIS